MEKRVIILLTLVLLIILSLSSTNALTISEIESNPDGKDSKNEWIEFFSPTEIKRIKDAKCKLSAINLKMFISIQILNF